MRKAKPVNEFEIKCKTYQFRQLQGDEELASKLKIVARD